MSLLDPHLRCSSPAVNAGDNTAAPGQKDKDGNPRIVGETEDLGAYELQSALYCNHLPLILNRIAFSLKGKMLRGEFALVKLKGRGRGNEWLLFKKKDDFASDSWKLAPKLNPARKAGLKERIPPYETS